MTSGNRLTIFIIAGLAQAFSAHALGTDWPMAERRYSTGVSVVQDGLGCTIVYPARDAGWRELALRIAEPIKKLGARDVPVLSDTDVLPAPHGRLPASMADKPLILLGDLGSNRAVFPFYANYYTYCDAMYPGSGGHLLQTMVRPFGSAANCLMVGAARPEDARPAVEELLRRLAELEPAPRVELPYCLHVKLGSELQARVAPIVERAFQQEPLSPPTTAKPRDQQTAAQPEIDYGVARDRFTSYAHLYFYTGHEDLAHRARDWGLYLAHRNAADEKGIRIADYTMENLVAAWRRVSPAPVFTPEQRQILDTRMYETAALNAVAWWRQKGAIPEIGGRHHTTGMLAWWTLLRCLLEVGAPDDAARAELLAWRAEAEGYLDGLLRHNWDDLDDYQSADSAQITLSYALQTGKLEWFDNGMARLAAQKLLALTDNMGWYVGVQGYGEAIPGWERFTLNGGLLLGSCAFVYQDGGYRWLLDRFAGLRSSWGALQPWGLRQFATSNGPPADEPDWMAGMHVLRLTPYRIDLQNQGTFLASPLMDGFAVAGLKPAPLTEKTAFDKIVFRGSSDPAGAFLLLQGMSGIALSTIDMNSIVRYTDQGRIWLIHNTGRMSLFFKNAVYVSSGLNDEPVPAACELVGEARSDAVSMVSSRLAGNRGTDWTRSVISCGNRFTVVIDQVQARRPGEYVVSCNWRTPGWAHIDESGWTARQDDVVFRLLPGEMAGMQSARFTTGDGATRPTVLRQNRRLNAAIGDSLFFENLLYTHSASRNQTCEVRRVAPGVLAVGYRDATGQNQTMLAFANTDGIDLPGLATDAIAGFVSPDGVTLSQATFVRIGERSVRRPERTSFDIKLDRSTDKELLDAVRGLLAGAWHAAGDTSPSSVAVTAPGKATKPAQPAAHWTHEGPARRGALIDGATIRDAMQLHGPGVLTTDWMLPTLVAEPRLSPQGGSGLAFEPPKHMRRAEAGEPPNTDLEAVLHPLADARLTLELPESVRIDEIELTGSTAGSVTSPMPPAELRVELTFSEDGFNQDRRTRTLALNRRTQYHNLYKGHAYAFETYRAERLDEQASAVRVRLIDGPSTSLPLNDLQVRTKDPAGIQPIELRALDLDGDGTDEILCWARHGELLVLDAAGKELWRRDFGESIVAVDAWDLEHDRKREVFVSLKDWRIIVLNLDGSIRWEVNWADMKAKTDGKFFSDGSLVYGMAAWQPEGRTEKEVLLTSYYFAARLDSRGNVLDCFRRSGHHTQIREVPAGLPHAGGLVTRSDIPWTGPVPLEWLEPGTGKLIVSVNVPNGPAALVDVGDHDGDGQPDAIVATEQGIGLYAPAAPNKRWEHLTEAALAGAGVIRGEPARIVYARQDGYLFVVDVDGNIVGQRLLDEPAQCLTAITASDGRAVALVATTGGVRCVELAGMTERWRMPGDFQAIAPVQTDSGQIAVAVQRSGRIISLRP